ncbi:hypothetical protein CKA38_02475 [Ereboglobus luteus]|uniref:N-acetyltransferase domain-containing protein n=1 Tax=Ereboglobus luteus TaxID=1796921 RepID=A0A2U8E0B7_9BACT|nr:hypothetical protein CKA38_02475 [Ereboglobus luteus]
MADKNDQTEYIYKIATEDWEIEQIHRLNYRTFVEEIPQHAPNTDERLVDRFHAENTYIICLQDRRLMGMLAIRGTRPFSIDSKLANLDAYLPTGRSACEVRLLAVEPDARKTVVFPKLFEHAVRHCLHNGYDICIISATTRQLKLYRHLGFVPFGPLVGSEQAQYQPMYLTLENFGRTLEKSTVLRSSFVEGPAPSSTSSTSFPAPSPPPPRFARRSPAPPSRTAASCSSPAWPTSARASASSPARPMSRLCSAPAPSPTPLSPISSPFSAPPASSSPTANSANASQATPATPDSATTGSSSPGGTPSTWPRSPASPSASPPAAGYGLSITKRPPAS